LELGHIARPIVPFQNFRISFGQTDFRDDSAGYESATRNGLPELEYLRCVGEAAESRLERR
jgi:hypothetical protein